MTRMVTSLSALILSIVLLVSGNASTVDVVYSIFGEIEAKFGPVDIVVANATPDQPHEPIENYDWEFYQSMLDFFIKSPYLLARRALPGMKEKGWGRFINITSEVFHRSVPQFSAYVAAKGGQIGWSRSMASELRGATGTARINEKIVPSVAMLSVSQMGLPSWVMYSQRGGVARVQISSAMRGASQTKNHVVAADICCQQ